jgi:hypothetical protein
MKEFKDFKQMENAGWDNMRSLLDQHMPQKKRRFALLFFMFFIFGLAILFSFLSWLNHNNSNFQKTESNENPLATEGSKEKSELYDILILNDTPALVETRVHHQINTFVEQKNSTVNSKSNNSYHLKINEIQKDNSVPDKLYTSGIPEATQFNSGNVNEIVETTCANNQHPDNVLNEIPMLPILALMVLQSNDFTSGKEHLRLKEINNPIYKKTSGKFQFGAQAGIQYLHSNKSVSYLAGTQLDYKIAKKWSISLSPILEVMKGNYLILDNAEQSFIVNSLDSLRLNTDLFRDAKTEIAVPNSTSGLNSVTIERYNYLFNLQLPLTLNYKINRYLQTSLGMKFLIPLQKDLITSQKSNIIQWTDDQTSSWKINPVNYFLQSGITYFPSSSIGLSVDYSLSLSNLKTSQDDILTNTPQITNPVSKNNMNHFTLSLKYKFR